MRKHSANMNCTSASNSVLDETFEEDFYETIEHGSKKKVAWAVLNEFFSNVSITGARFFSERKRHWSERVFWIIAFMISFYLSWILISASWNKWNESPVIVSFAEKATLIWAIPFPAVTICPESKFSIEKFNFTEAYHAIRNGDTDNLSDETISQLEAAAYLCIPDIISIPDQLTTNFTNSIFNTIYEVSIDFEESMFACEWLGEPKFCYRIFQPILTEEGVCSFNALNSRDIYTDEMALEMMTVTENPDATHWTLEEGYKVTESNGLDVYPYRMTSAGAKLGLSAFLRIFQENVNFLCRGPSQGFKILLHSPDELPQISKHYFRVPPDQEVLVSVQPEMITTSKDLIDYHPSQRGCYFKSERQLRFFKKYTQRNCELECVANFTKSQCGCVKFSMPRDKHTPVCGSSKLKCSDKSESNLLAKAFTDSLKDVVDISNICNCLPACTSISYAAEISQAKFDMENFMKAYENVARDDDTNTYIGLQFARLTIFFKEHQFTQLKRSELYGLTDFRANCGGLLGLFIGISVLGIVEIIYFFTLRLCCTLRMHRPRQQKKNSIAPSDRNIPNILVINQRAAKND